MNACDKHRMQTARLFIISGLNALIKEWQK